MLKEKSDTIITLPKKNDSNLQAISQYVGKNVFIFAIMIQTSIYLIPTHTANPCKLLH